MIFGFSGFLDKFEAKFGPRLTGYLLFLLGLSVAAFSLNVVYNYGLKPVIEGVTSLLSSRDLSWHQAAQFISDIGTGLTFIALALIFVVRFREKRIVSDGETLLINIDALLDDVSKGATNAHSTLLEAYKLLPPNSDQAKKIAAIILDLEKALEKSGRRVLKDGESRSPTQIGIAARRQRRTRPD